ncbi:hypothetical protein PAHAL_9G368400 [Panicum hallii]|uniref:Embryo surrounding factor 1 brassicaceae domain-containing protein n=1 Tax=Panicum hallii TaxID=206008 RepID=A0A2S3IP72_9POAL|nr:hypothetical protein PAHAL_9G368400 [Panicum hallii]
MGGTATGSMACVRTMLLLVAISARLLASPAANGSKITLVFCILGECNYFGHGWQDCYCCGDQYRKQSCHPTKEECRAHCPLCNPTCSPAPPTLAATTNAASYN